MDPRTWFKDLTAYFLYLLLVATIGPFLFGFHLAELNAPEDVIRCNAKAAVDAAGPQLPQCMRMTAIEWGLVGSIFTLGGLVGALSAGPTTSRYGRVLAMQFTTAFFALGPIFEALAPGIAVIAIGRFISGIGAGAALVVVPIYVSEVAPPTQKGFFGAFTQVMINTGILIAQLLGYFLSRGQYWRIILAAGGVIGLAQTFGLYFVVESPKWLVDQGRPVNAKRNLRKIRGDKFDLDDEVRAWGVQSTQQEDDEEETLLSNEDNTPPHSQDSVRNEIKHETLGILDVIRHPDHNKAVLAVMIVMCAQQLTGINSIIMYGVHLLSSILGSNSALVNLLVSAVNIIVTAAAAPLVDSLGRKICLLTSITGMGISALLLGVAILNSISALSGIAVLLFVSSFAVGLGPVPFILASELVDTEAVGATQSWALVANWVATFIVAQFFPLANQVLHGKVYFVFTGLAALFVVLVAWKVPETKGKSTVDEVWGREERRRA